MKSIFKCGCPITSALDVIGDRWILIILKQMLFEKNKLSKTLKKVPRILLPIFSLLD